jgi:anti-sigma-K factor RskA
MEHEDYKMMLPLQALSGLDRNEAQALEQHLVACAECRMELDDWGGTANALAHSVEPLEPSPEVRARILESVRAESQAAKVDNVVPMRRLATVAPRAAAASRGWQAIAALILLALLVGLVVVWRQNQEARTAIARLTGELQETNKRLEQERQVLQLLSTPGTRMAELSGTKEAPKAHGMLAVDKSGRAVFMAQGLPQVPPGKAYQLWFIAGAKPMPGKVFKTDPAGNVMMMDEQLPPAALNAGTFAVTLEPQDGVPSPTGPMYLLTPAPARS